MQFSMFAIAESGRPSGDLLNQFINYIFIEDSIV